jgi:hypothetical protein
LQFRAGSPDPAYGGIAAESCPLHRLVTSGPDVALKRLDLIRQRFGADSKTERPGRSRRGVSRRLVDLEVS